jgi:hypothetical protein
MIVVGIYIKDSVTLEYNRVELFSDEKISVNSSIQNVNDISKTYSDYSHTFVVPASKQNNKIFRHWYENSNDNGFSTLTKADAYIEIDTIPFRSGKIQLESCNVKDGQPQDYSITFIGALGSLKDKFNGLYLKDLTDTTYDFAYSATVVKDKVVTTTSSADVMFPLISSDRYWGYGGSGLNDINDTDTPIRYNELFPALRLKPILNMIETKFGINFDGTTEEPSTFLTDARFTNAYLWLKNAEEFISKYQNELYTFSNNYTNSTPSNRSWVSANSSTGRFKSTSWNFSYVYKKVIVNLYPTVAGINYKVELLNVTTNLVVGSTSVIQSTTGLQSFTLLNIYNNVYTNNEFEVRISAESSITFSNSSFIRLSGGTSENANIVNLTKSINQTITVGNLAINQYMPEIKIEDFFSGLLKMFNLTCYSKDGVNYTIKQLEDYYTSGTTIDITKYIKSDSVNLNRVKTYKKINFEYEKSESLVNVGFNSANGLEYGSLFYDTTNDGDEYNIKLPFEDLNFNNLQDKLQVGYTLKTDLQKYIPKPVILYDYNPTDTTDLTSTNFYFSTALTGTGTSYTTYKAFGQEYNDGTNTYTLNFPAQQSTLTNEFIDKGLYEQYYSNYITNIFDSKARLIKVSGILPTSLLTTLKLNDRLIIRDKRYLINTFTTDLTTGEVQFELLTDFREL